MTRREALKALGGALGAALLGAGWTQWTEADLDAPLSPEELAQFDALLKKRYALALERLMPEELSLQRFVGREGPVYQPKHPGPHDEPWNPVECSP